MSQKREKGEQMRIEEIVAVLFLCIGLLCVAIVYGDKPTDTCREATLEESAMQYRINTRTKKIHKDTCGTGKRIAFENLAIYEGDPADLIEIGFSYCQNCF